jgi:ribosome biogenesis GTPase / thiamine phosphate phosphatase
MAKKKRQIRVDFRKKYETRTRDEADLTRKFASTDRDEMDTVNRERVSGKGQWMRKRTVTVEGNSDSTATDAVLDVDLDDTLHGIVIRSHGLESLVVDDAGNEYRCALRRLLKSVATDQRHVVVAGDRVHFRPESNKQGLIVRIEPRSSELARSSREKRHVIAANVDQVLIVTSAGQPNIKPHLIDRLLVTAEHSRVDACICINKCDLIDPTRLQPLVGTYAQMGYRVLLLSATRGWNTHLLQKMVQGKTTVVIGQSGVGKSSLLNVIESGLQQRVQSVSQENSKGRHTTTSSQLFPLKNGGALIDTPGVRQFQLWDIAAEELSSLFRDVRPLASKCKFPDCTHTHENDCYVKGAVADYRLDVRRYESYIQMRDDPLGQNTNELEEEFEQ